MKDNQYQHCLVIIDEAPDIISHLASQTWKNRLMNVFTRAIRHGRNNLFMTAQNFEEIDKGLRRQTDIIVQCDDLPTKLGRHDYPPGSLIEMTFLDNNGAWTSHPFEEQLKYNLRHGIYEDIGEHYHLFPTRMWGDDEHKPVYDSWIQFDVFETLKRVDIELSSQKLVDPKKADLGRLYVEKAIPVVEAILKQATSELPAIETKEFYTQIGALTTKEKDALAKRLNSCDVRVGVDSRGKRYYDFTRFKFDKFRDGGHD
ncbi:MAG: hypothetical protein PHG35_01970 [Dehalococcoidales bacterium]|nr:hypothetical protein [Dehalococcoidales bacterium]